MQHALSKADGGPPVNTVVIGIGNRDRADDALGLLAVDRLQADPLPGVRLATARGDVLKVLDLLEGADTVILIDAMKTGTTPGHVLRLDASRGAVKAQLDSFASTHTVNLAEAVELARALGKLPPRLIIYGVEAADFTLGNGLSPAVEAVLEHVIERVREDCACTKPR
jgi:hydrogenase maturation protease